MSEDFTDKIKKMVDEFHNSLSKEELDRQIAKIVVSDLNSKSKSASEDLYDHEGDTEESEKYHLSKDEYTSIMNKMNPVPDHRPQIEFVPANKEEMFIQMLKYLKDSEDTRAYDDETPERTDMLYVDSGKADDAFRVIARNVAKICTSYSHASDLYDHGFNSTYEIQKPLKDLYADHLREHLKRENPNFSLVASREMNIVYAFSKQHCGYSFGKVQFVIDFARSKAIHDAIAEITTRYDG